jgi:hypothetical protein
LLARCTYTGRLAVGSGLHHGGAKGADAQAVAQALLGLAHDAHKVAIDGDVLGGKYCNLLCRALERKAVEVHHLGPRSDKVLYKFILRIVCGVDLRHCAQLRVGTKN